MAKFDGCLQFHERKKGGHVVLGYEASYGADTQDSTLTLKEETAVRRGWGECIA